MCNTCSDTRPRVLRSHPKDQFGFYILQEERGTEDLFYPRSALDCWLLSKLIIQNSVNSNTLVRLDSCKILVRSSNNLLLLVLVFLCGPINDSHTWLCSEYCKCISRRYQYLFGNLKGYYIYLSWVQKLWYKLFIKFINSLDNFYQKLMNPRSVLKPIC